LNFVCAVDPALDAWNGITKQHEVFDYGEKDIVKDVLDEYNGAVFAYGQTGSGKTFTMMGADLDLDELKGIIPRIAEQIFQFIVENDAYLEYLVKVSYMEIYLERSGDLLAPQNDNLQVHEEKSKGVYMKNLSDYYGSSIFAGKPRPRPRPSLGRAQALCTARA
jgi:kinesin family protein 5